MLTIDYIFDEFKITKEEYSELDDKFGDLCHFVAWDLKRKNSKNNLTDELEDITQDLRWSISRAGVYTKRQRYIESSFEAVKKYVNNPILIEVIAELEDLWNNRTRHGANKQKFGSYQEGVLSELLLAYVPENDRPDKNCKLQIDKKFETYCKAILWNQSKNLGKKMTRDRRIRSGMVSLSEHSYMCGSESV